MKQIQAIIQNWKLGISIIIFCLGIIFPSKGQLINYIPDPSFEDTIANFNRSVVQKALLKWQQLDSNNVMAARCLYFSQTTFDLALRLPSNNWFFQYPRSGGGVVQLENVFIAQPFEFKRSLVKCRLKQPLIAGKTYYAMLYCVSGERTYSHFSDGISMYFDNGQLDTMVSIQKDSTGIYPQVVPQVINPYGNVITDTVNWTKIEGCFVANGTETYLTIGNFKSNSATALIPNPNGGSPTTSGLLIDDVSVYPTDLTNWLPPTYGYAIGDSATIGLPNYETPDAKWYTYNMQLIDSGSQIKVLPPASGTKYICGIDMCNTMVFDTVEVVQWPLAINTNQLLSNACLVYPNPTANTLHITNAIGLPKEFFSLTGQMVIATKDDMIDVSNFARGMYYLKCKEQVIKVIIE